MTRCRVCQGSGWVAQKQTLEDGWGEVDSCPACDDHDQACESELTSHGYTPCRCDERREKICIHGHKRYQVGCVSCVLVHRKAER